VNVSSNQPHKTSNKPHTLILDGIWGRPRRWESLRRKIEAAIGPAEIFDYECSGRTGFDELGKVLLKRIDEISNETGGPINIVAHSMGGLVARAAHLLRPEFQFNRAVLMNSPISGTWAAYLLSLKAVREMRPESEFLKRLKEAESSWKSPTLVTWCVGDVLVFPNRNMRWPLAEAHRFGMPAHNWPRWSGAIHRKVIEFLK